ncbi:putative NADH-flavin reductase [Salsuginibacillus halophilus]|uniref:Putative NADH-flavin reductase n=1 Tax=Salsuginibacillus halophilus TaxID=517424 RepID=A0A2P8HG62_9BACI|nr:NAD(P)H-binding protein [Salsuginibacillus halophilus]PSL45186.1 putative NADH-flavin reductase [Salsuginibacillus halophilus]
MKIAVFGATGRTGSGIIKELTARGYNVQALVRPRPEMPDMPENVQIIQGDAKNKADIAQALEGADAVISALSTDKSDTLTTAVPLIIEAMQEKGIQKILTIGTAGILNARTEPDLYRFQSSESRRSTTRAAEEHARAYEALAASSLRWTVLCPTYLPDGEAHGNYRLEENVLPENGSSITTADTAKAAVEVFEKAPAFESMRVGLAY